MALLKPRIRCYIRSKTTANVFGEEQLSTAKEVMCAIVKLKILAVRSTVRADSSASRGGAEELQADAVLLFLPDVAVSIDDQIEIAGHKLRVTAIQPRHTLGGQLDHNQIEAVAWSKE